MDMQTIWLGVLTLVLVVHIVRDAMESKKIKKLEDEVSGMKANK